jgi:hypothetical protein
MIQNLSADKKKKVAIVIPTHKTKLNSDDLISLKHLEKYLNKYDKYFVIPGKIDSKKYKLKGYKFIKFENRYFQSWRGYNELLLNKEFYLKFKDYEYILIYQLDVLVFSSKLDYWMKQGYDYIAAPWFRPIIGSLSHKKDSPASGGNGGFSLRKVSKFLKVFEKIEKRAKRTSDNHYLRKFWFIWAILTGNAHKIWLNAPADNYPFAEDGFWALEAPKYLPEYKVAPFKKALSFAFERFPKKCFEINNKKLPFGVHAWKKYDEEFWKPFLLKD